MVLLWKAMREEVVHRDILYFISFDIKHTEIYIQKHYSQRASPWMKANPAIFGALTEKV